MLERGAIATATPHPGERARTESVVEQYARTPLDLFKLWPDKSYCFSPSGHCVIAYRLAAKVAVALGDPVGPDREIEPAVRHFLEMCDERGWRAAFHQTLPDF